MTRSRWAEREGASEDAEKFFAFVGKYMITFQAVEGKIEEVFLMSESHENRSDTFQWLSKKTNNEKIDEFQNLVKVSGKFKAIDDDLLLENFDALIARLHNERRRRNTIIHSQYLFDILSVGDAVLGTTKKSKGGELIIEQELFTPELMERTLNELSQLCWDMNMTHLQLINLLK